MYPQLYKREGAKIPVRAGLIGVGSYGTAVLTQSMFIPYLHVAAVADSDPAAARRAFRHAGIPEAEVTFCDSREAALRALPARRVIVEDPLLLMDLPLDVIAESTGSPEAGARNAYEAIQHGKHVAMISKEPDSVVGPILNHLANRAGVIYTQVDGDQHGLLIGWVAWLRSLGLEIVAAGKARDGEGVFNEDYSVLRGCWNPNSRTSAAHDCVSVSPEDRRWLRPIPEGETALYLEHRRRLLSTVSSLGCAAYDLCESVIAMNATGLVPDFPAMHDPLVRVSEIPQALCAREEGGILQKTGVIDVVTVLRGEREANMGGGVFAVVSCENAYSRGVLLEKGLWANPAQTAAVIFRPHHLCGVETSTSILCAGLLGMATGNDSTYRPQYDMAVTTLRARSAGEILNCEHDSSFKASIIPAVRLQAHGPLPAHMTTGRRLKRNIAAGTMLSYDDVDIPADSILYRLRKEQDDLFGNAQSSSTAS